MKKILLTLVIFSISQACFAQQYEQRKIEIINKQLNMKLEEYIAGTKLWAKENDIPDYMICMLSDSYKEYNTITLTAIRYKADVHKLNLSFYTEIKATPVLIENKLKAFFGDDSTFVNYVLKKYNKNLFDFENYKKERSAELKKKSPFKTDSVIIPAPGGNKKVAVKDMTPIIFEPTVGKNKTRLFNMELVFYKGILQSDRRYVN